MKSTTAVILLCLLVVRAAMAGSNESITVKAEFRLISVESASNHGPMGHFAFRHHGPQSINIFGEGFTGTNVFRVTFAQYQREENGKWKDEKVGYCGNGAKVFPIHPNRDYIFVVPLWPLDDGKGGQGIVEVAGTNFTVRSEPFETTAIRRMLKNAIAPANRLAGTDP